MNPAIEALGVALTAVFATKAKNFCLVKQFYYLTIERCPLK